ncbi:hypothetical protein NDU88_001502 [Pleurodeles waltl]|uniref:Uncharacterized protein n=1 Tax=Pleurodeles waltl TaxID=8319 RepID=A0AAV7T036_PLEWA|nr:hypothetical protein NDU88_001502 [Pleurodeles waltl]
MINCTSSPNLLERASEDAPGEGGRGARVLGRGSVASRADGSGQRPDTIYYHLLRFRLGRHLSLRWTVTGTAEGAPRPSSAEGRIPSQASREGRAEALTQKAELPVSLCPHTASAAPARCLCLDV